MNRGYFRIYRCIQDNPMWQEKPFDRARAWIDLVLQARYEDGYVRIRGVRVELKRGDVGVSEVGLSDRWGWSRGKVKRFLDELESEHQIEQQKNNVTSLISIVNYDLYQSDGTANDTANSTANDTANGQQTDTNKKGNKGKKVKKESIAETDASHAVTAVPEKIGFDFETGKFTNVNGQYQIWCEAYPAIDVMAELKQMAAWLVSNPKNRKSDYPRFINNWLSRAQNRAPRVVVSGVATKGQDASKQDQLLVEARRAARMQAELDNRDPEAIR